MLALEWVQDMGMERIYVSSPAVRGRWARV